MDTHEHYELIQRYADVCNQALLQNKDRFPFKQILGAAKDSESGCVVEVSVSGDLSSSYVFEVRKSGIFAKPHDDCAHCNCDRSWSVEKSYLQRVAEDPLSYIENPAMIDWEWMYDSVE